MAISVQESGRIKITGTGGVNAVDFLNTNFAFLFPAFYLSFKFGYHKVLPAGKFNPKFAAFILVITSLCVVSRYFPLHQDRINIKVNYVAEYNKITRPPNYDPNDNAAPYYQKAFELSIEQPEQLSKSEIKVWPKDLPEEKQVLLQNWVSANSDALEQLKLGTQRPYYWPEYKGDSMWDIAMPSLGKARFLTYATCARTRLNATEGNFKEAFSDLLICYKFGKHFTGRGTLVGQLIGIAIRSMVAQSGFKILDGAKPGPNLLENFQQHLEVLNSKQSYTIDFTAERLLIYDNIQRMFTDDGKGGGHVYGTRFLENKAHLKILFGCGEALTLEEKRIWRKLDRRQTTKLADEMFEYFSQQARKTPWHLHDEGENINKVAEEMTKDNLLVKMLTPNAGRVMEMSFRVKVHTDALITTLALLRYKADKGQLPENLNQLVLAGYLKGLPIDPFSDNPLI